jgi:hypothetical protein
MLLKNLSGSIFSKKNFRKFIFTEVGTTGEEADELEITIGARIFDIDKRALGQIKKGDKQEWVFFLFDLLGKEGFEQKIKEPILKYIEITVELVKQKIDLIQKIISVISPEAETKEGRNLEADIFLKNVENNFYKINTVMSDLQNNKECFTVFFDFSKKIDLIKNYLGAIFDTLLSLNIALLSSDISSEIESLNKKLENLEGYILAEEIVIGP